MKDCAIILNGNDVIKVTNLKRKYKKLVNNPNIVILEEVDKEDLDLRYSYWKEIKSKRTYIDDEKTTLYLYRDSLGHEVISIYDNLNNLQNVLNTDEYVKIGIYNQY